MWLERIKFVFVTQTSNNNKYKYPLKFNDKCNVVLSLILFGIYYKNIPLGTNFRIPKITKRTFV